MSHRASTLNSDSAAGTRAARARAVRRLLSFGVPFAALCVLFAVGLESLARTTRALARLERADEIRFALDDLTTALDDASNAQRAFLITHDATFREARDRTELTWPAKIAVLRALADSQRADVDQIASLVDELRDLMDRTAASEARTPDLLLASDLIARIRVVGDHIEMRAESLARARVATAASRRWWEVGAFGAVVASFVVVSALVIVQRRRDEERRRRAEERAALLDVTEEFIGVLGHDLRNPLGASLMAAKLLSARPLPQVEAMLVGRIRSSNERMLRLIDELLDLARTRLGPGIPVVRTRCDLRDIVSNVVDEIRTRYPDVQIRWDWRGDGMGLWDHDRMSQVVSNLVGNAIEHGDHHEPVEVHLERIGNDVSLAVHNFGPVIEGDALPTLFAAYKDRKSKPKGLGLGLFIADQIVRAHDGAIAVRSTTNEGTTFTASFGRSDESVARAD